MKNLQESELRKWAWKVAVFTLIDIQNIVTDLSLNIALVIATIISFAGYSRPTLVIPWVVIQELDVLKDSKNKSIVSSRTQVSVIWKLPMKIAYNSGEQINS